MLRKPLAAIVLSALAACGGSVEPNPHRLPRTFMQINISSEFVAGDADTTMRFDVYPDATLNRDGSFLIGVTYIVERHGATVHVAYDTLHWRGDIVADHIIVSHAPDAAGITADTLPWLDASGLVLKVPVRSKFWTQATPLTTFVYLAD